MHSCAGFMHIDGGIEEAAVLKCKQIKLGSHGSSFRDGCDSRLAASGYHESRLFSRRT